MVKAAFSPGFPPGTSVFPLFFHTKNDLSERQILSQSIKQILNIETPVWTQKILSVMERGLYEVFVGQSWLSLPFDT